MSALERWKDLVYSAVAILREEQNILLDSEVLLLANSMAHRYVQYDHKNKILITPINGLHIQEPLRFMRPPFMETLPHVNWNDLGLRITAQQLILQIIKQHPIAGLYDSPLVLLTWSKIGGLKLLDTIDSLPRLYKFKVISKRCYYPENITRARRYLISKYPKLVEAIRTEERRDKAEWFREQIKQFL